MAEGSAIRTTSSLTPAEAAAVQDLVRAAAAVDGAAALNEAAVLHLRHPTAGVEHLLLTAAGDPAEMIGYGQLQGLPQESVAAVVVHPGHRRRGAGRRLLAALLDRAPHLRIWARQDAAAARGLADALGLTPVRRLQIMSRDLDTTLEVPAPPDGLAIRTFDPASDVEDWLAVNGRAFATHPEQGRVTRADLEQRMAEPWFDAAGFFVARRTTATTASDGAMVGFHWTKQHPDRVGEVYVLGVDPTSGVRGLGRPLLLTGLAHLRERGNRTVILYVESDNAPAVRLYTGAGFGVVSADVMYGR